MSGSAPMATVVLFRASGKYYTEERWRIPDDAIGPYDMSRSPDFRRVDGGPVLVETQEPWGYPHMFPSGHAIAAPRPHCNECGQFVSDVHYERGAWGEYAQRGTCTRCGRVEISWGPR